MQQNHQDLGRLVKKASAQLSRKFNRFARQYHLTAVQMSLIDFLNQHRQQKIFQKDVEREFLIRRSTASVLLARMEKHGLLIRRFDPSDARQRYVTLTPRSLRLEHRIVEYMHDQQRKLEGHFPGSEMQIVKRFLYTLINFH